MLEKIKWCNERKLSMNVPETKKRYFQTLLPRACMFIDPIDILQKLCEKAKYV